MTEIERYQPDITNQRSGRKAGIAVVAVMIATMGCTPASAATSHRIYNSKASWWNIGAWSDNHCGGKLHLVAPGHHRSHVRSIKAYGEDNVLIRPHHKRKVLLDRHCYKVTGGKWKVVSQGE